MSDQLEPTKFDPNSVECVSDRDVLTYMHEMLDRGVIAIMRETQTINGEEIVVTKIQLTDGPPPYRQSQLGIQKKLADRQPSVLVEMLKFSIWSLRRFVDSHKKPKR